MSTDERATSCGRICSTYKNPAAYTHRTRISYYYYIFTGIRDQYFFNLFSHPIFLSTRVFPSLSASAASSSSSSVVTHGPSVLSVCVSRLVAPDDAALSAICAGHHCWRLGAPATTTGNRPAHTRALGFTRYFSRIEIPPESSSPVRNTDNPFSPESPLTHRSLFSDKIEMFIINRPPMPVPVKWSHFNYRSTTTKCPARIPNVQHTTHSTGHITL